MTLYEIDKAIYDLVDSETGEIEDFEALDKLQIQKAVKIENIALFYKNELAQAAAIKSEEAVLHERRKAKEKKAESLKRYLDYVLSGEKFETAKVKCGYRKSKAVDIADENRFIEWAKNSAPELISFPAPKINKTAVREAIEKGQNVEHAVIVDKYNISIR